MHSTIAKTIAASTLLIAAAVGAQAPTTPDRLGKGDPGEVSGCCL